MITNNVPLMTPWGPRYDPLELQAFGKTGAWEEVPSAPRRRETCAKVVTWTGFIGEDASTNKG